MTWRSLAAGLLAGAGLLAWAAPARADDTVRLKLTPGNTAPTVNLKGTGDDAEVMDVGGRGGFHGGHVGHGGFHGGHVGFHGGHVGFHGSHVGFSHVGFRGGFGHVGFTRVGFGRVGFVGSRGWGWGRGGWGRWGWGWGGWGWGGWGWGWGSPGFIGVYPWQPIYAPSWPCSPWDWPISDTTFVTPSYDLRGSNSAPELAPYPQLVPPNGGPRTYPYDGGPAVPVPMPKAAPDQLNVPRTLPDAPTDRAVALPASGGSKFAYPAYGDKPQKTQFAADRVEKKNEPVVKKAP